MEKQRHLGAVIIEEILNNMRAGAEPLYYTVQVPGVYHVYIHHADYEKLQPITHKITTEAKRVLDEELAVQNRRSQNGRRGLMNRAGRIGRSLLNVFSRPARLASPHPTYEKGGGDWQIKLYPDTANDLKEGDVVVESELASAVGTELGAGLLTKTIRTVRLDGMTKSFAVKNGPGEAGREGGASGKSGADAGRDASSSGAFALISYKDGQGNRHDYLMRKEKINVGKGDEPGATPSYWVDLVLDADADISPLHLQLFFDPASRKFFVKDLSVTGTRINGRLVKNSMGKKDGRTVDLNVAEELPPTARISLANKFILDFKSLLTN